MAILKWIGIFALVYVLLLPFGGYRPYRARIIRYDTFMPVTVALIYFFGISTYLLLHFKGNKKIKYVTVMTLVLLVYTFSDLDGRNKNRCEREALEKMALSQDGIVSIPKNCFVMSWTNTFDYQQSENRAKLIHYWGITRKKKLFFNEQ